MRAMGIRFVAVRSDQERKLLEWAISPGVSVNEVKPISRTEKPRRICEGDELLWPVQLDGKGIYELAFQAEPNKTSAGRWFVRLEDSEGNAINRTQTVDPVDLSLGTRRMRFLFICDEACDEAYVRIKSEMGWALSVSRATFGRVAELIENDRCGLNEVGPESVFLHCAKLSGGIDLYELPGSYELVYWADQVKMVEDLRAAVELLQQRPSEIGLETKTVIEFPADGKDLLSVSSGDLTYNYLSNRLFQIKAKSKTGGFIILNQSFDPGWNARVDGQKVKIYRANVVFQGIYVPAGEHTIRFEYYPRGLLTGLLGSIAGLITLVIVLATAQRQKTRNI